MARPIGLCGLTIQRGQNALVQLVRLGHHRGAGLLQDLAARQIRGFGGKVGIEVCSSIADTAFDKRAKAAVDQPGAVEFGGLRNAIELTDQPPALPVLSTSARKT